jgi:hypothetical protein
MNKHFSLALLMLLFVTTANANNFNSIKMSCELRGDEVSLNPQSQPGARLRKYDFPDKINFAIDRVVYVSDGRTSNVWPTTFEALFELPQYEERFDAITQSFENPTKINIARSNAVTTAFIELGRENIVDVLDALGSVTAGAFRDEMKDVPFTVTRYFPAPERLNGTRTVSSLAGKTTAEFDFTGRYANQSLETCYQIDPVDMLYPDDPYFDRLSYHLCGRCKVELLESSAAAFAPNRAD